MGELQDLSVVDKFAKSALQSTLFFGTGVWSDPLPGWRVGWVGGPHTLWNE